ncbi:MAG: hypothetical protein WA705_07140 [Candidatus Ozemobacteraceae bacterium]
MNPRTKAVWGRLLSIAGIILVFVSGLLWFPAIIREKARVQALRAALSDRLTEQAGAAKLLEEVKTGAAAYSTEVAKIRGELDEAQFSPRMESEIPAFIEEMQKLFAAPGLRLRQLAYVKRIRQKGFVTFPFEGQFQAGYDAFRTLMTAFESHSSGVRIERIEFLSFDDDVHAISFKLACGARFRENPVVSENPGVQDGK